MANKFVAVFLLCMVVAATMCVMEVQANEERFKSCFKNCQDECQGSGGHGNTFCEMKCDADCGTKEAAAKLEINL